MAQLFEGLLTVAEAAEKLGISRETLKNWTRQGKLTAYQSPGGHWYYRESDIDPEKLLTVVPTEKD
jgi:excisionase family DNA binding protein